MEEINNNVEDGNSSNPSGATTPSPILQQRIVSISPTPTPPPSPMILAGLPMFFQYSSRQPPDDVEPIAYSMSINGNGHDCNCKSSAEGATTLVAPGTSTIVRKSAIKLPAPPIPPPLSNMATPALSPPGHKKSVPLPLPPPPPPPKSSASSIGMVSSPSLKGSGPPPPLPLSVAKALRAKKANTKLKRSIHTGNLYRLLKGKVEGSSLDGRASNTRTSAKGSACNAQGMTDALSEMTKRSAYFRQIEEDVEKYAVSILDLKSFITTFQSKNMAELVKFHQYVEQCLECLTNETQILARFEGFPSKKLETIRMAAALNLKLDTIIMTLKNWKLMPPVVRRLDKVECYFNRVKEEVDVIERNKEEESKRFQSQNIAFDFSVLLGIKESMVDLSSNCIEMVLKERKEAKEMARELKPQACGSLKMLWRAFQLAFRVYNFSGGQDDRADRLTSELAHEIETCLQL